MLKSVSMNFGEHLTIDGYGGSRDKLDNKALVFDCLSHLPDLLGMNKLAEAVVYHAPGNGHKDPGGWSGFVVIAESHISIHTFPARGFISADVYTCRNDLDQGFIINFFKETFKLKEVETNFIKRGTRYPDNIIY